MTHFNYVSGSGGARSVWVRYIASFDLRSNVCKLLFDEPPGTTAKRRQRLRSGWSDMISRRKENAKENREIGGLRRKSS